MYRLKNPILVVTAVFAAAATAAVPSVTGVSLAPGSRFNSVLFRLMSVTATTLGWGVCLDPDSSVAFPQEIRNSMATAGRTE